MTKTSKGGLGKGLDAIFADNTEESASGVTIMRISDIEPRSDQPRKRFNTEALSALSASIAEHGMIQPIGVRCAAGGFYEIIAGERRWRAAKMAGINEVPVIISDYDDEKTAEIALIENIQRENLSAVEEAMGYRALMEEYGFTQEQVAAKIGKSRPAVANTLRLLELPDSILTMITEGHISAGHARALLSLEDRSEAESAARIIVKKDLSVRQAEELVRSLNRAKNVKAKEKAADEVDYLGRLETRARSILGRKVKITNGARSKKIELSFEDDDDLEELLLTLCGKDVFQN